MKIIYYRHNKNVNAVEIPSQKISFCELTIVLKGSLIYKINGTEINLSENQCIFVDKNSNRQRLLGKEKTDYISFNFTEYIARLPIKSDISYLPEIKFLLGYCDARFNALDIKAFDEFVPILEIIITRINESQQEILNPLVNRVKNYVKDNLSNKISLKTLSEKCHYSVSRLSAVFKQETNVSVTNYIIDVRINKAKGLLAEGISDLEQITYEVGFSDINYFIRTFKKRTGTTPLQYRKTFIDSARR